MREQEWLESAEAHKSRVATWVSPRLERRARGEKHPVWDFLFDYYPFSPSKISVWHPGYPVLLEGPGASRFLGLAGYVEAPGGVRSDLAHLSGKLPRLDLAIRVLHGTLSRPAVTGCFGLHEWAMTYKLSQAELRHSSLPLRLPTQEIARTIEAVGLRCTHIDAYRFFTPEAIPLNSLTPTRATQPDLEQSGCLHAAMDLYKLTGWFLPLTNSDLLMDCFENAALAREIDMRASPYDLSEFGMEPIRVETTAGRREYAAYQQQLMTSADPLRRRLLADLEALKAAYEANSRVAYR